MANPNNDITFFAKTNFRNKEVPFGIRADDRRRHMYVIGKTGMGKTTLMENMVIQDIRNGHGVCFIDPHGDSVVKILDFIPANRVNDVVYINPADMEHPIAFNILEAVDSQYKHLVASGLMGVFTKIWANMWSARMEYILNNTILALLDSPGNTMLGIVRMYVDKKYRKKIVDAIKDPVVKSFWIDEFAQYAEKFRTEAVAPIQNKVGQFLSSAIIRNIVGQPKSTIDLRDIMDNNKIMLLDLSKGRVGEDNSKLLGAMIITKLQLAALSRVDIPESERKDFYLYVDEFQNFVNDAFATILSEARKYRLNLTIGHQYIAQLVDDRNTKVRDAVFGNVGTTVVFRVGAADAEYMETEFAPTFTPNDIVNLPKANVILRLMINGVASEPFSAITLPPISDGFTGNKDKVIQVSRERYSNPVAEVEEKISRWMGAEFHEATAQSLSGDSANATMLQPSQEGRVEDTLVSPSGTVSVAQGDERGPADSGPKIVIAPTAGKQPPLAPRPPARAPFGAPRNDDRRSDDARRPERSERPERPPQRSGAGERRQFDRRRDDHSFDRGPRRSTPAPASSPRQQSHIRKPENSIWQTAGQMQQEKDNKIADNLTQGLESAFSAPKVVPAPAPEPVAAQDNDKQIIKPGEVHKF